ncbi:MAG: type II toxin-antitoxin system HicA family toxin [bacterium]
MRLTIKPQKVIKVLKKIGFEKIRQTGSHLILANRITKKIIPVPIHNKDIKRGLLLSIIKQADLTKEAFIKLLN